MVPTIFIMIELDERNELFLKKKFQEAIEKYQIVLEKEPNNSIALNNKGYSFIPNAVVFKMCCSNL